MIPSQNKDQLENFARSLNEEIREKADQGAPFSTEVECFADAVLTMFEDAGVIEHPEVCVRQGRLGRSNWELAGWAFPPSEEEDLTELTILSVLYNGSPEPTPVEGEGLRRRFELAINFIEAMLRGRASELEVNDDVAALGRLIFERRPVLRRITVHLATDGVTQRLKSIASERIGSVEVTCAIWDIERLSRLSDPKQEEIEVDVRAILDGKGLPFLRAPSGDPTYEAYLCVIPATLLNQVYEQYGQRLLELNVRAFLSAAGQVNKGIRDTIRNQPDRFFPYNNGLALTAHSIELAKGESGQEEIVRINGLQVVNGGQTTASIHRAWKLDGAHSEVERVFVPAKLTVITTTPDDGDAFIDLVRNISKYANSQNAVKADDLEANQPWHVTFEKLSRSVWAPDAQSQWYYERSRGSYATAKARASTTRQRKLEFERQWPRAQLVTKTDLAKAVNAWDQRPEIVSLGGQKNFRHFMDALADQVRRPTLDEVVFRRTIARVILFRDATRLVAALKAEIPAFRNNVVAYLVAYLSFRTAATLDFDRIWEKQSVPEKVKKVMRGWARPIYEHMMKTADGRNPGEWCKKADCWTAVRSLNLPTGNDFLPTPGATASSAVDADDADAISECIRLPVDEWQELFDWCLATPSVKAFEREVISKLRRGALHHWPRHPDLREARHARRLIRTWRKSGSS